ncbi:MAG: polysaccharide biosynthesis C-terminal domain-containing protein [Hyphomicrobiales bacterium]|nr:polysaccharide biosynthesis C-terminal domain-containing protein [Hyphomicrobiales bacterium]
MVFAVVFFANSAANFAIGLTLSALLGPAEFGRYATAMLAAMTLATALFDWLRLSSQRFSGDVEGRAPIAASLDLAFLVMMGLAVLAVAIGTLTGVSLGFGHALVALTPLVAIANARCDYSGAQFRARDQAAPFAALYAIRQTLTFTVVVAVAIWTREAGSVIAAMAIASLAPVILLGAAMRTPGAALSQASRARLRQFVLYAKPVVASTVIYQLIGLINRQTALTLFGAAATGKLSLATDLGLRLFLVVNVLPEILLFQYALKRDRQDGREAASRQIGVNSVIIFAILAPLTAGYMTMAPTFEALMVPAAYRGDFARLSLALAPGFFAYCALYSTLNPVFQLAQRTWPLTLAAVAALVADLAMLRLPIFNQSVDGIAAAYAASLAVGFLAAAIPGFRERASRPALRDLLVIAGATAAMSAALEPLNAMPHPFIAAALALLVGAVIFGGGLLLFDVAGLRTMAMTRLGERGLRFAPLARTNP